MNFIIVYSLHDMGYTGTDKIIEYPQPQSGDVPAAYTFARQSGIETHIGTKEKEISTHDIEVGGSRCIWIEK